MNDKINELYNNLDAKDKIINEQALEIARLKEQLEDTTTELFRANKKIEHLKEKIDILIQDNAQLEELRIKAIEYIKENAVYDEETKMCCFDLVGTQSQELLELLGGKQ